MKSKALLVFLVFIFIMSACTSNVVEDSQDSAPKQVEEVVTSKLDNINDFGKELLEGVWVGELILDFYEGFIGEGGFLTKQYVKIDLEAEFEIHETRISELVMHGHMEFTYDTPQVEEFQAGIKSVTFYPETNSYTGPYKAQVARVEHNLPIQEPAHINFLDIASITGGVTVHVDLSEPDITQVYSYSANEGAIYATDLYMLRFLGFINLTRIEDGKAVFSPHSHLDPSPYEIPPNIYGHLQRVILREEEPLISGETVSTDLRERLRTRIESQYAEWDLYIEPNTTLEYSDAKEELKIVKGALLARVRRISEDYIFRVMNPVAITGVRGTDFYIRVIDDSKLLLKVYSGEVEVYYQDETYKLNMSEGILILDNEEVIQTF